MENYEYFSLKYNGRFPYGTWVDKGDLSTQLNESCEIFGILNDRDKKLVGITNKRIIIKLAIALIESYVEFNKYKEDSIERSLKILNEHFDSGKQLNLDDFTKIESLLTFDKFIGDRRNLSYIYRAIHSAFVLIDCFNMDGFIARSRYSSVLDYLSLSASTEGGEPSKDEYWRQGIFIMTFFVSGEHLFYL